MKIKKLYLITIPLVLMLILLLAYIFRPMTMNDIYKEPNFKGIVTEVYEDTILVSVNEDEDEFNNSEKISVSLNVKLKDSMTHFSVGDNVSVYYNGVILDTIPAQVDQVYAIILRDAN
ncbi:MAG: DUF3221 domain-containing protein [Lachnoclostridium sp.]|jgi:hypothetical protein